MDEFSDLDFVIAVETARYAQVMAERQETAHARPASVLRSAALHVDLKFVEPLLDSSAER